MSTGIIGDLRGPHSASPLMGEGAGGGCKVSSQSGHLAPQTLLPPGEREFLDGRQPRQTNDDFLATRSEFDGGDTDHVAAFHLFPAHHGIHQESSSPLGRDRHRSGDGLARRGHLPAGATLGCWPCRSTTPPDGSLRAMSPSPSGFCSTR